MAEVLKWCWSNTAKIQWEEAAVNLLLEMATEFYNTFSSETIPLVSIDMKWKLARLSVSLAYFTLSTNEDFSIVTVTPEHVQAVINFITEEYTKAGLGILAQENKFEKLTIDDIKDLFALLFNKMKGQVTVEKIGEILHWIVTKNRVTKNELTTKFLLSENNEARPLLATLQTEGLLKSGRGFYSTSKLIEAYRLTQGFDVNILNTFNILRNEPPTPENDRERDMSTYD